MSRFYNIHNKISVELDKVSDKIIAGYDHYFRSFGAESIPKGLLDYKISGIDNFRVPDDHLNAGNTYIGFNNGCYFPKEHYAIAIKKEGLVEYVPYANKATNLLLNFLLLSKGMSFIHGAGMEINGKGIIFPAFGGAGKTTLIAVMRKSLGFKFFGDDYVMVDSKSKMYSYPSDFSIYPYHLEVFPELKNTSYSRQLKIRKVLGFFIKLKKALYKGSQYFFPSLKSKLKEVWDVDYVKVPAAELISKEKIGDETEIKTAVFLSRYNGNEMKVEKIELDEIVRYIVGVLHVEFKGSLPYLYALAGFGKFNLSNYEVKQEKIIMDCFSKLQLYRVLIPYKISNTDYSRFMRDFVESVSK